MSKNTVQLEIEVKDDGGYWNAQVKGTDSSGKSSTVEEHGLHVFLIAAVECLAANIKREWPPEEFNFTIKSCLVKDNDDCGMFMAMLKRQLQIEE